MMYWKDTLRWVQASSCVILHATIKYNERRHKKNEWLKKQMKMMLKSPKSRPEKFKKKGRKARLAVTYEQLQALCTKHPKVLESRLYSKNELAPFFTAQRRGASKQDGGSCRQK